MILSFLGLSWLSKAYDSVSVFSAAMNRALPAIVVKPYSQPDSNTRYPVLYLLHGYSGDCKGYVNYMSNLQELSERHKILFVCPDGGYGSWYWDSPIDPKYKFETFIANELVEWVDANYPTIAQRNFRAIGGLSMGGHGAVFLTIKHPEVYSVACSASGGLDFRKFPDSWEIEDRLGKYSEFPERWDAHCVAEQYKYFPKHTKLLVDCGVEDFMMEATREVHQKLLKKNIDHVYIERPGAHDWNYWRTSTLVQIEFVSQHFREQREKSK